MKNEYIYFEAIIYILAEGITLLEKCSYSDLFWFIFSSIWTEYLEIRSISPYSVRIQENTDQNNSEYGHFLRSVIHMLRKNKTNIAN